jgi:Flp pilus assembly protein CpaB
MGMVLPRSRRWVRRNRRALAAGAAGLSVLALGTTLRPDPPTTRPLAVASRDLATGHRLSIDDLRLADVPDQLAPPGGLRPEELSGRVLAAPVSRGEPIAAQRLLAPAAWTAPAGTVPLPVRFADAGVTGLLSAGQRVDVLAAPDREVTGAQQEARVVAAGALVLAVADSAGSDLALGGTADDAPVVVLAVTRPQALTLVGAQAGGRLWFALAGSQ